MATEDKKETPAEERATTEERPLPAPVELQPTPVKQPPPAKQPTPADKLWEKIKELPLELYSLPNQTLSGNCTRVNVSPDQLHLKLNSGAVVAAMTEALKTIKLGENEMFDISSAGVFTTVKVMKTFM